MAFFLHLPKNGSASMKRQNWKTAFQPRMDNNATSQPTAFFAWILMFAFVTCLASCGSGSHAGPETSKDSSVGDAMVAAESLCSAPKPVPDPVVLHFKNATGSPLFYYLGCFGADYSVSSEASGFTDELAPRIGCPCDCGERPVCPACGACYDNGTLLKQDTEIMWYPQESVPQSCSGIACIANRSLPFGRYRLRMTLYASEADAVAHSPAAITVVKDFEYSTAEHLVEVTVEN
jgi:hypothetical protein